MMPRQGRYNEQHELKFRVILELDRGGHTQEDGIVKRVNDLLTNISKHCI